MKNSVIPQHEGFKFLSPEEFHMGSDDIIQEMSRYPFMPCRYDVDRGEYSDWLRRVDYEKNYPSYLQQYKWCFEHKTLQHYISLKLMPPKEDSRCIDIASSTSCFSSILTKIYNVKCVYKQDFQYPSGVNGNIIGSNATAIPLGDHSIECMYMHCSYEHFEGNSDIEFWQEASRLLVSGGRICIIPLYFSSQYCIKTSPSVWENKYAGETRGTQPFFDPAAFIVVDENICQRHERFYTPAVFMERIYQHIIDDFNVEMFFYYIESLDMHLFSLLAIKK
jgi:hypothetical protein